MDYQTSTDTPFTQDGIYNPSFDWGDVCPAFTTNNVVICMASSNEYSPYISVVIQSIIDNSKQSFNYDFIILHTDITEQNQNLIAVVVEGFANISLRFVDVTRYIKGLRFHTRAHFTPITYYRLLVPYIFHQFPKILYLDSDVVVNHDISELYEIDITGYIVGAARDTHVVARCTGIPPHPTANYFIETLALEHPENYFQCGVLLYNISEMREAFPNGRLIIEGATHELMWLDQDLLNMLMAGRVKIIPNYWNVMVFNNKDIDEYNLQGHIRIEYFEARNNPRIIHYIGRSIPCYRPTIDMYWYFWRYARQTPYYELFLSRMTDEKLRLLRGQLLESIQLEQPQNPTLKAKIKDCFVMPIVNCLLPASSNRRKIVKDIYYKLRGWSV